MTRDIEALKSRAQWLRREVLERTAATGKGHIGGIYSCAELLVALYYGGLLQFDAKNPAWRERDRFLLGKGHACLGLYPILVDLGMLSQERYETYGKEGGLGGQLDVSIPGAEFNTGSLGHALGIGAGIALAAKMDDARYRAIAMLGDAECYEGSIWEALVFAGQQKLDRLIGVIDRNRLSVTDVLDDDGFFGKFSETIQGFGWECHEINGHAFPEIFEAFDRAEAAGKPVMIVANTIKGKGISFMEHAIKWHHGVPTPQELAQARKELGGTA